MIRRGAAVAASEEAAGPRDPDVAGTQSMPGAWPVSRGGAARSKTGCLNGTAALELCRDDANTRLAAAAADAAAAAAALTLCRRISQSQQRSCRQATLLFMTQHASV